MHSLSEALLDFVDRPGAELAPVALLLARLEYPHVDAAKYLGVLESMGDEALRRISHEPGHDAPLEARVDRLSRYLHVDMGFVGNRDHYEDPRNSCLNQVLDRRIGIPITLSVVYIEVARRAGFAAEGISFPGHFLTRIQTPLEVAPYEHESGSTVPGVIVDPFGGGSILHDAECRALLRRRAGSDAVLQPEMLASATRREIVIRMLYNLKRTYVQMRSFPQARGVTDLLVALMPTSATELRDRGLLAYHLEDFNAALRDLEAYLRLARPAEQDDEQKAEAAQTWEHVKALRRRVAGFN